MSDASSADANPKEAAEEALAENADNIQADLSDMIGALRFANENAKKHGVSSRRIAIATTHLETAKLFLDAYVSNGDD